MKLTNKLFSGVLVTVAVGASVAGAQGMWQDTDVPRLLSEDERAQLHQQNWERHVDQLKLVDDGNYDAWKQFMLDNGREMLAEKVTAEDFAKLAELYDAFKAGDYARAKELGKDLKMPLGMGMGGGRMMGGFRGRGGDGSLLELPVVKALSQEVQAQLRAAHEAGDGDLVRQILEDNGIQPVGQKLKDRCGQGSRNSQ